MLYKIFTGIENNSRMKKILTLAMLCCLVAFTAQAQNLKVISYNIWNGFDWGNDVERKEQLTQWVNSQDADVVALQELCGFTETKLKELAQQWGHNYAEILKTDGYPVGITSRKPIEVKERIFEGLHHGALHCQTFGIDFFVIHLSPFSYEKRHLESELILSKIKAQNGSDGNCIVLGDFNALSPFDAHYYKNNTELLRAEIELEQQHEHVRNLQHGNLEYGVLSKFLEFPLNDVMPSYVSEFDELITYPSQVFEKEPGAGRDPKSIRIDYILVSPSLSSKCIHAGILNNQSSYYLSDHYPVFVELDLKNSTQAITIKPYLQDASPHSMVIMWETDSAYESIVEWGITEALGNVTEGISYSSQGEFTVHEVGLCDLEHYTNYFYRVKAGNSVSEISKFKTPPHTKDHRSFRLVAMSDMQKDQAHPDKFREIVEDGVISYFEDQFGGNIQDNLALVMIPGDLVVDGNNFTDWKESFFTPSEKLFRRVPVYPAIGNHERNSAFYFRYFKLPDNGTEGYEEHWWYKDYGNLRFIGLDSNAPYDGEIQLNWLDSVLNFTCSEDSIDFIFAQLHHPHKSELWVGGESDFTGQVIERLENFSTDCSKPSIHFFGHTHGYSRGHSMNHKHLWINVATAGGSIDDWGEFANFDYDEFAVSQDEYGFVMVEVTDDNDPKVVVKRISRGDASEMRNNVVTDSVSMSLKNTHVSTPIALSPHNESVIPECVKLVANQFSSTNEYAEHGQSHWQVSKDQTDFSSPLAESWKNFENWYDDIDTQKDDDLADEEINGLEENTTFWWRVRYRDKELNWSTWSTPATFKTLESRNTPNLILNPGAEEGLVNWGNIEGVVEALEDGECSGITAYNQDYYFCVGGICEHSEVGILTQEVDVSTYSDSIDTGFYKANFGGYLSNYGGIDLPGMSILFVDGNGIELDRSIVISSLNSTWTLVSAIEVIPRNTRVIKVELKGTRKAGTDNDCYFDDLFLKLGSSKVDCNIATSAILRQSPFISPLKIIPNPIQSCARIELPQQINEDFIFGMIDLQGQKFFPEYTIEEGYINFKRDNLTEGIYIVCIRGKHGLIGKGKLVIKDL